MSSEFKRFRDYELMVIFHPELSEEDLVSQVSAIEGHITAGEATITLVNRESPWGRRRLAYPIRHESRDIRDGVYVLYYFTAESTRLTDLEREIKLNDRVLRYLLTQQIAPIMEPVVVEEEGVEAAAGEAPAAVAETPATEAAVETEVAATEVVVDAPEAVAEVAVEEAAPAAEAEAIAEEAAPAVEADVEAETPVTDDETA